MNATSQCEACTHFKKRRGFARVLNKPFCEKTDETLPHQWKRIGRKVYAIPTFEAPSQCPFTAKA
jgi:hypothetical protein